jgi:hypothetical protein
MIFAQQYKVFFLISVFFICSGCSFKVDDQNNNVCGILIKNSELCIRSFELIPYMFPSRSGYQVLRTNKECILNGMVSIDTGFSAYLQHGTEDIVFQFFPL